MTHPFIRTEILLGPERLASLANRHVLVAGVGGVGGFVAESLARAGVGRLTLVDHDVVSPSNLNRQLVALHSTLGCPKVEVMADRLRDIHPGCAVSIRAEFITPDTAPRLVGDGDYDFVCDCIDAIACKAALVAACLRQRVPVASSMGAGNRLDTTRVRVASLNQTRVCPLARELRARLRKMDVPVNYPVVYSDEEPAPPLPHQPVAGPAGRPRAVNGTISYMPALFGTHLAALALARLLEAGKCKPME